MKIKTEKTENRRQKTEDKMAEESHETGGTRGGGLLTENLCVVCIVRLQVLNPKKNKIKKRHSYICLIQQIIKTNQATPYSLSLSPSLN